MAITTTRRIPSRPYRRPGFTLIDVLVSMAVIAVLISLLTPSLTHVRETAHQVVCRSNVRQFGIGIMMYAGDSKDLMPHSYVDQAARPWDTIYLRYGDSGLPSTPTGHAGQWDGLGTLNAEQYLEAPKLYYCPSHRGNNPFIAYADQWAGQDGPIIGNYQYRGGGPAATSRPTLGGPPFTRLFSAIEPTAAIVADSLRSQTDYNHIVGSTVLRANLSVSWYPAPPTVLSLLPRDNTLPFTGTNYTAVWDDMDDAGK